MSDRKVAKQRVHRGISAKLREDMRQIGVALDEEAAQFALNGLDQFVGEFGDHLDEVINSVMTDRLPLMRAWEEAHPNRNPFPPSFPERVLKIVRDVLVTLYSDDAAPPIFAVESIKAMCERELESGPLQVDPLDQLLEE